MTCSYEREVLSANKSLASAGLANATKASFEQPAGTGSAAISPLAVLEQKLPPDAASFRKLLQQRDYERSIVYYETALQIDESYQALLKPRLEDYLKARVQECAGGVLVDLVDLWLAAYYADIEVLLLLADNRRFCSSSEEAAMTLQIASTYAIQPRQQERVAAAVDRLIIVTDKRLSQQQNWIELLGFYEFLEAKSNYDLGFFDRDENRVEPVGKNPFAPKV